MVNRQFSFQGCLQTVSAPKAMPICRISEALSQLCHAELDDGFRSQPNCGAPPLFLPSKRDGFLKILDIDIQKWWCLTGSFFSHPAISGVISGETAWKTRPLDRTSPGGKQKERLETLGRQIRESSFVSNGRTSVSELAGTATLCFWLLFVM